MDISLNPDLNKIIRLRSLNICGDSLKKRDDSENTISNVNIAYSDNIEKIFDLIKINGPRRYGINDKYIFQTDHKLISSKELEMNRIVYIISIMISDREKGLELYNLYDTNRSRGEIIMRYLSKIFVHKYICTVDIFTRMADEIDEIIPKYLKEGSDVVNFDEVDRRNLFIESFGFSIPSKEAINHIIGFCRYDKILELGAGLGLWSRLMAMSGIQVVSTDVGENGGYDIDFKKRWTNIEFLNHIDAIKKYGSECNVMFLSWPTDNDNMATESVILFPGQKIIYIGDGVGGTVVENPFFEILTDKYICCETIDIPQWCGFPDKMFFFQRKEVS